MRFVFVVRNWGPDTVGVEVSVEQRSPGLYAHSHVGTLKLRKQHWEQLRALIEYPDPRNTGIPVVEVRDDAPAGRA